MGQFYLAGNIFAATSALGTAAYGVVDATKVYRSGVSKTLVSFLQGMLSRPILRRSSTT
jgi:hypothetical protein